jgi:hypothetical protein
VPDGLADIFAPSLEDIVGALADILDGDTREFLVAHGYRDGEHAVRAPLRAYAEVDEVLPVERRQQERGRQPGSVNARRPGP